jgi:hypothetical protein
MLLICYQWNMKDSRSRTKKKKKLKIKKIKNKQIPTRSSSREAQHRRHALACETQWLIGAIMMRNRETGRDK